MRSRGFNHRFAFALPFGLACAHSGVWQCRPAATLSGLLPPSARDPAPRLPPASPSRCISPGPTSQPARLRVVRPFSPFAWRLVAHVDLDLVEPAGVYRQVDEDEVRPAPLEAVDGFLAAVGGAVVDDPEDAARGGVRLLGHHLPDEPFEGGDPTSGFGAAEDPRSSAA